MWCKHVFFQEVQELVGSVCLGRGEFVNAGVWGGGMGVSRREFWGERLRFVIASSVPIVCSSTVMLSG